MPPELIEQEVGCEAEAVVQLFRTDVGLCEASPVVPDPVGVLERAGVRGGKPFVLGPDGSYDRELNRFFQELDGWGVRSENGVAAYARDVMLFCRFLHESRGGKSIWECDGADLRAYKVVRLRMPGPGQVTAGTWNRSIAALDTWVAWAKFEKLLEAEPFRYVDKTVLTPQGLKQGRANAEHESDPERRPPRFLPMEDNPDTWRREIPSSAAASSASATRTDGSRASRPITSARRTATDHSSAEAVNTPSSATPAKPSTMPTSPQ